MNINKKGALKVPFLLLDINSLMQNAKILDLDLGFKFKKIHKN
jgi:hypothetical protein